MSATGCGPAIASPPVTRHSVCSSSHLRLAWHLFYGATRQLQAVICTSECPSSWGFSLDETLGQLAHDIAQVRLAQRQSSLGETSWNGVNGESGLIIGELTRRLTDTEKVLRLSNGAGTCKRTGTRRRSFGRALFTLDVGALAPRCLSGGGAGGGCSASPCTS